MKPIGLPVFGTPRAKVLSYESDEDDMYDGPNGRSEEKGKNKKHKKEKDKEKKKKKKDKSHKDKSHKEKSKEYEEHKKHEQNDRAHVYRSSNTPATPKEVIQEKMKQGISPREAQDLIRQLQTVSGTPLPPVAPTVSQGSGAYPVILYPSPFPGGLNSTRRRRRPKRAVSFLFSCCTRELIVSGCSKKC